jgi:hypothetical protein
MALLKPYPIRETLGLVRFAASRSPIRHARAGNLPWQAFQRLKFRCQPTLGDYYLDFFCEKAELNTELDTSQHVFADELQTDAEREKIFAIVRHLLVANRIESSDTDSPAKRPSVQGAKLQ